MPLPKDTPASIEKPLGGVTGGQVSCCHLCSRKIPSGVDVRCTEEQGTSSGPHAGVGPKTGAWGRAVLHVGISVGTGDRLGA